MNWFSVIGMLGIVLSMLIVLAALAYDITRHALTLIGAAVVMLALFAMSIHFAFILATKFSP